MTSDTGSSVPPAHAPRAGVPFRTPGRAPQVTPALENSEELLPARRGLRTPGLPFSLLACAPKYC